MGMNMDMRKWNWPGYLTFGKGNGPKRESDKMPIPISDKEDAVVDQGISHVEVEVSASALEDAISSDSLSISRLLTHTEEAQRETPNIKGDDLPTSPPSPLSTTRFAPDIDDLPPSPPSPPPLPEFSMTRLHLAPLNSPMSTAPVTIHYFIVSMLADFPILLLIEQKRDQIMLALIKNEENVIDNYDVEANDLEAAAKGVLNLFDEIHSGINDADLKRCTFYLTLTFGSSLTEILYTVAYLNLYLRLPKSSKLKIDILSQRVNTHRLVLGFHPNRAISSMQWLRFHREHSILESSRGGRTDTYISIVILISPKFFLAVRILNIGTLANVGRRRQFF